MAVTRRVHVVQPQQHFKTQLQTPQGQWAQIYADQAVDALLKTFAPAERIVSTQVVDAGGVRFIYIFTESFGLGPVTP